MQNGGPLKLPDGIGPGPILLGEQAKKAQEAVEAQAGMRCGGCHRRVDGTAIELFSVDFRGGPQGQGQALVLRTVACTREDCDFRERARAMSIAERVVEWHFLDGGE